MYRAISFWIIFFCLFTVKCYPQRLTRLYKSSTPSKTITKEEASEFISIELNLSGSIEAYKPSNTIKKIYADQLSEKGQLGFFEALSKLSSSSLEFHQYASKPLMETRSSSASPNLIDNKFEIHFKIPVKNLLDPVLNSGRISELEILIKNQNPNFLKFYSFKDLNSTSEYFNFGEITETRERNFSLKAGTDILNSISEVLPENNSESKLETTNGLSAELGGKKVLEEKIVPKKRILTQMGTMTDDQIYLYFQSTPENDLSGEFSFTIVVETEQNIGTTFFSFKNLFKNGSAQSQELIDVLDYIKLSPILNGWNENEVFSAKYKFNSRKIINRKGRRTAQENDDKVTVISLNEFSEINSEIQLKKEDWKETNEYWIFGSLKNGQRPTEFLSIQYFGSKYEIKLNSLDEAQSLLSYLRKTKSVKIGGHDLLLGEDIFNPSMLKELTIFNSNSLNKL